MSLVFFSADDLERRKKDDERGTERVLAYCAKWGVEVKRYELQTSISDRDFHRRRPEIRFHGPIAGGIGDHRSIWWPLGATDPHALLHELSHCLDWDDPSHAQEIEGPMLAFEQCSSRFLRLSGWSTWIGNYGIGDGREWCETSARERGGRYASSLAKAIEVGILDTSRRPTFRRPPWMDAS